MRILITNDDGIDSPGLSALAEAAMAWAKTQATKTQATQTQATQREGQNSDRDSDGNNPETYELVIAAPASQQSGSAASMGTLAHHIPIACSRETLPLSKTSSNNGNLASIAAYRVDATPGACVILGCLGAFGEPPDIVLSGINYGANCGRSVLPSGTIGAALTAANYGRSGLAVSLDAPGKDSEMLWDTAAEMACDYLGWIAESPKRTVASLNVPNRKRDDILGVRFAPPLAPFGVVVTQFESFDEENQQIRTKVVRAPGEAPPDSDRDLLLKGWAVLTPLTLPSVAAETLPPTGVTL